ncbi:flippase [Mucilaginibacter agri]|uniref:Oligosaccharide flippase family protein n=1 Tax=Mucilaginibacter agri TaxID=2695265 RepID=A0A965ZI44_9SPHI|nr:flippase [Mucilaginibacter agri]NCD70409.1 oligosaccharide flippase family protein [Mucilaginibacter agri]
MRIPSIPGFDQQALEKYFKNAGMLLMARVGSMIVKFIINSLLLSRYLGPKDFGILNYPMAIVTFSMAIAALGLDGFITRELLNNPQKKNTLLGTAFWMRLAAGVITLPFVYVAYQLLTGIKPLETPFKYVLIVAFTAVVQSVNIIDSFFQSRVQGKHIMYVNVAGNVISAVIKLILILLKLPLIWFVYSLLLDAIILATGYIVAYIKQGEKVGDWKYDGELTGYLLKYSWPLAFSAVLVTIYMKIDQIMIPMYTKASELGIYKTAADLSENWYFIPVAIVSSVFPAIMNARKTDVDRYHKRLQNMYDLMVLLSLGIAITMSLGSTFIYHLLYKPAFWNGAPILSVHVWAGLFVFLGVASSQYLIAEGYTKLAMLRTGMGAIVNVVLNIFWIPEYGIIGAAYATLIAYGVSTFFIIFIPKTSKQGLMMLKSLFLISLIQKLIKR